MQKKRTRTRWPALVRRGMALFTALATGWLLWLTADFRAAAEALKGLADSTALSEALLYLELGGSDPQALAGIDRLAVAQSALLRANLDTVAQWLEDHEEEENPEESSLPHTPAPPALSPPPPSDPEVLTTSAPEDIVGRTMVPGASTRYVSDEGIYIYNYTDYDLDVKKLLRAASQWELAEEDGPQVLIYHSHATEAYTMDGTDIYEESDAWRTTDPNFNMIRIGEEMKAVFEAAGLEVIHDITLYDYPTYSGAYDRSAKGLTAMLEEYPTVRLVLDVHRDALEGSDGTVYKTVAGTADTCAQVMMVVGSNASGQTHSGWEKNLSLAVGLQRTLLDKHGTLTRPIVLRSSRFNQQLCPGALLVEVGSHGNTLQEAITAARLFAQSVVDTLA